MGGDKELKGDSWFARAKRFRIYGGAFLILLGVASGVGIVIAKTYAFAQKVDTYIKLPEWLERVEGKVNANTKSAEENGKKLDRLLEHLP